MSLWSDEEKGRFIETIESDEKFAKRVMKALKVHRHARRIEKLKLDMEAKIEKAKLEMEEKIERAKIEIEAKLEIKADISRLIITAFLAQTLVIILSVVAIIVSFTVILR